MILNYVPRRILFAVSAAAFLGLAGCGSEVASDGQDPAGAGLSSGQTIVATTGIWADVVNNVSCGAAEVLTLIPAMADPHGFEPSLADRARLDDAALIVANGLALEEGLEDTIDASAEAGTPVFYMAEEMSTIAYGAGGHSHGGNDSDHEDESDHDEDHDDDSDHDDHEDDSDHDEESDHEDESDHDDDSEHEDHDSEHDDHDSDESHEGSGEDPHVWFDPLRVSSALPALADRLVSDVGLDRDQVDGCLADYQAELEAMDETIVEIISTIPEQDRKLVTNHDSLGYFADRYGFEVIGTIIPAPSGLAETNPAQLQALAELIEAEGVVAVFTEPSTSRDEADALADQIDGLSVIPLPMGSLGEEGGGADSYLEMLRTNAEAIGGALGSDG